MAKYHEQFKEQLKQFLQQPYDGADAFLENVIYPVFGHDNFESSGNLNVLAKRPDLALKAETSGIRDIRNIGELYVEGSQLDIFDITLDFKKQLQRNRVEIQRIIFEIISSHSGAFIIFHYDSRARWEWRFTFLNKGANAKERTDAKRYTFLLGPGQSCRTAAENFVKIFEKIDSEGEFEMDDIVRAFDVEALSKEFFGKYKVQYEKFCQFVYEHKTEREWFGPEFETWEDKRIRDYVKRMLGRIVFLHFLQKKGWLGVPADEAWGEGDMQFMKHLFDKATPAQQANYLDEVLEPLFADALDTDRTASDDLFDTHVPGIGVVKVPYLNGGLFEKDEMDEPKSVFPVEYFRDLFTFFYQYNFTIDENDPDDAQVGVDPEMLGRIFENLLEDNKDKGAFYTPKEIVQYMCRESLIAYLTTTSIENGNQNPREKVEEAIRTLVAKPEEIVPRMTPQHKEDFGKALRKVRICDPAIGSGAFPMGLLNELVRCRAAIDAWAVDANGTLLGGDYAALKSDIVSNSIYGVDIEKGAVDIARLRFWLSIIVDEQTPKALPNLDYKIMQGNSLISTFAGTYVNLSSNQKHENINRMIEVKHKLYDLKQKYYTAEGDEKHLVNIGIKDTLLTLIALQLGYEIQKFVKEQSLFGEDEVFEFTKVRSLLTEEQQRTIALGEAIRTKLKDESIPLRERAQIGMDFFDWHIMFTEVFDKKDAKGNFIGGFDIVIGNPPYIPLQDNNGYLAKLYEDKGFRTFNSGGDIYCLFYEHGYNLLRPNGVLCYITSSQWIMSGYGKETRSFLGEHTNPMLLVDFTGLKIFETATVDTNILLFAKARNLTATKSVRMKGQKKSVLAYLQKFVLGNCSECGFSSSDEWIIQDKETANLKKKIKESSRALCNSGFTINRGILTGFNDAFIISYEKYQSILSACINSSELERTKDLIRPVLRGRDVRKWGCNYADLYLINTHNGVKNKIERIEIQEYPAVKSWLDSHIQKLSKRTDKGATPYNLRNCAYIEDFAKPKIVYPETTVRRSEFFYDETGMMLDKTTFFIVGNNLKFLQGILTSRLMEWYLEKELRQLGKRTIQYSKQWMDKVPIVEISSANQQPIITLVDEILSAKKTNPQADTTALEAEIDRLVYDLYGLTEDEIAIVEGTNK